METATAFVVSIGSALGEHLQEKLQETQYAPCRTCADHLQEYSCRCMQIALNLR
jgi:hypothetical protein